MKRRERGEGSVYQRADDGRWCASIGLGYDQGKYQRKVLYGKTRKEVADKLKEARKQRDAGMTVRTDRQTVAQFLINWLALTQENVTASSYAKYEQIVRLHLLPTIGKYHLTKLTAEHVANLLTEKRKSGLSASSVGYIRVILSIALKQAMTWRLVSWNVAAAVSSPKRTKREVPPLGIADVGRFLTAVQGERLEALFVLALLAGLRHGELLGLRWDDIDFTAATVRIQRSQVRINHETTNQPPKTAKSRRTVGIPFVAVLALKAHAKRQEQERSATGAHWQERGAVFTTAIGEPLDQSSVRRHLLRALARAGLPHMRLHDLRHAYASLLLEQNVHPKVVQEALGHSGIGITMDLYSHVMPSSHAEIVNRLDVLLTVPESNN